MNEGKNDDIEGLSEILERDVELEERLKELPNSNFVISIIKSNISMQHIQDAPKELDKESLQAVYTSLEEMVGRYIAERAEEILKRPILMRELKDVSDISSLDPFKSREYLEALLEFESSYLDTDDWERAEPLLNAAEELFENIGGVYKDRFEARIESEWGLLYWKSGDYEKAEEKFKKAKKIAEKVDDKGLLLRIYHGLGVLYGDSKKDKTVPIEYNEKCLDIIDELEQTNEILKRKASVLNNIGVAYHKMAEDALYEEEDEAEEYLKNAAESYRRARDIADELDHLQMKGRVSFNLGEIHAKLDNLEKAKECSEEAREIYEEQIQNDRGLSGVEMLDAVINRRDDMYDQALDHIDESLRLREQQGEPRRTADALVCQGDIYDEMDKEEKARDDYEEALQLYEQIESKDGVKRVQKKLDTL